MKETGLDRKKIQYSTVCILHTVVPRVSFVKTHDERKKVSDFSSLYVWSVMYGPTVKGCRNPARGQLNRKNEYFPCTRSRTSEFGLARWVRPSRPASSCSSSIFRPVYTVIITVCLIVSHFLEQKYRRERKKSSSTFNAIIFTYSRWTSSLPSCLWSQRIFPSLPDSRLTIFYRDASSALLLQLVNQWLNFTYSPRSHVFRYERKNTNPTLVRIELTTSALAGVQVTY